MSFLSLAQALAEKQPHAMRGGKAKIAPHPINPPLPARLHTRREQRKLMRPNNPMKAPRHYMESPRQPPLSIKE